MSRRAASTADPRPTQAISAHEVYTIREASRRLSWGRKTMTQAIRDGLPTVLYGRVKYVRGESILRFFRRLEEASDQASLASHDQEVAQ